MGIGYVEVERGDIVLVKVLDGELCAWCENAVQRKGEAYLWKVCIVRKAIKDRQTHA